MFYQKAAFNVIQYTHVFSDGSVLPSKARKNMTLSEAQVYQPEHYN